MLHQGKNISAKLTHQTPLKIQDMPTKFFSRSVQQIHAGRQ